MSTKKPSSAGSPTSPILNGPYQEPELHYATTPDGNLDHQDRRRGRRIFAPETPQVPLGRQPQAGMFDINDFAAQYRDHLVNHLRELVGLWRRDGYPGVTSRVTRELLAFWFENPQRATWQQLFFAQREAVESYVKNAFLGFDVPYVDKTGAERHYLPDFICRVRTPGGELFNLIVEITGFAKDKAEKRWFVLNRWLPAVNGQRDKLGLLPWRFVEVTDIERTKNQLRAEIERMAAEVDAAVAPA
ncbi:MAG: hypothetical protein IH627_01130 [Rubrivivax sp.]|nr:hypothetical protein [Rubrivivax sp.]